jgi:hypothetical protein
MAVQQDNGYFFCRACERDTLTREDFYNDKHKKHGLSNLCKLCESLRTRQPKHNHYLKSEIHKRSLARKSKRAYYLRNREEILAKSATYKRNNPGRLRGYLLKQKYKLTSEEKQEMIELQKGCCEICGTYQGEKLAVDHCHRTGKVRALLCNHCNSGLGFFNDDIELLAIARAYLYYYNQE